MIMCVNSKKRDIDYDYVCKFKDTRHGAKSWSPEKQILDRLWCVLGTVSVIYLNKFHKTCMIFPAFHSNFSNQGVGLITFKIRKEN